MVIFYFFNVYFLYYCLKLSLELEYRLNKRNTYSIIKGDYCCLRKVVIDFCYRSFAYNDSCHKLSHDPTCVSVPKDTNDNKGSSSGCVLLSLEPLLKVHQNSCSRATQGTRHRTCREPEIIPLFLRLVLTHISDGKH